VYKDALAACCTCGFFALDAAKNPDYPASLRSLRGKKSPDRRFFGVLCAKRDKLLGDGDAEMLTKPAVWV
jgi:hypothetical protein